MDILTTIIEEAPDLQEQKDVSNDFDDFDDKITIDDAHSTVSIDIEYMMTLISFIFIYFTLVYLYYIVGKWVGNQGFVMVAVPAPGSEPKRFGQQQHQQMVKLFMNKMACSFILPPIVNNPNNGKPIDKNDQAPYAIGMSASVPHGNAAMMFGDSTDPGLAGA